MKRKSTHGRYFARFLQNRYLNNQKIQYHMKNKTLIKINARWTNFENDKFQRKNLYLGWVLFYLQWNKNIENINGQLKTKGRETLSLYFFRFFGIPATTFPYFLRLIKDLIASWHSADSQRILSMRHSWAFVASNASRCTSRKSVLFTRRAKFIEVK